ncbi:MAG: Ferredoxin [Methanomassiliicoccales archaeon PtaU1.Bin124]|nr:MAG: Ferredoxin [Methanomassiliicoccales archaeon PtaU1.Bin124]
MAVQTVALVRCEDYSRELVYSRVKEAIDLLGGLDRFAKKGQRVLVKPNILRASPPDEAVCTHPNVIWAVCRLLRENGCEVVLAESPGAGAVYGPNQLRKAYETAGYSSLSEELGVVLNENVSYREVANPDGRLVKRFLIIEPAIEADVLIVVSKLKTHLLTKMTAATKNLFGVVPGMEKASFHGRLQDPMDFSRMLVDLNELMRPSLQIIDAIVGMEGDGPGSGDPRKLGAIIASPSYAAADVVAARMIGLDAASVPTIGAAVERGAIDGDLQVEVRGEALQDLTVQDFRLPSTYARGRNPSGGAVVRRMAKLVRSYTLRPYIDPDRCNGCGRCERSCPTKAIRQVRGRMKVRVRDCIRCYTCHEMCANGAIDLERSMAGKIMVRVMERRPGRDVK